MRFMKAGFDNPAFYFSNSWFIFTTNSVIMKNLQNLVFTFLLTFILSACHVSSPPADAPVVALSKSKPAYEQWLHEADSTLVFVNLYALPHDEALKQMEQADALLLTGGEDIHPKWYGQPEDTVLCNAINLHRDSLEIRMLNRAIELELPILGICRGLQIINVSLGGSLIPDIPSRLGEEVLHRKPPYKPVKHPIKINQASLLYMLSGKNTAYVVSNHHQGIDRLAESVRVVASTADGLPEAVEWKQPATKPFFLGVQFHPEGNSHGNGVSTALAKSFAAAARLHHSNRAKEEE